MLVRPPLLTSHKWRKLVSSGRLVCRYQDVFLWCYLGFVLLRFHLYFVDAAALRSIVLRYADAPIAIHTRVSFFSPSCLFGDVVFSKYFLYHCRFVERVRRSTFFPSGWCFSTLRPQAGFLTSAHHVRIQSSINQWLIRSCSFVTLLLLDPRNFGNNSEFIIVER